MTPQVCLSITMQLLDTDLSTIDFHRHLKRPPMQDWNNYRISILKQIADYAALAPDTISGLSAMDAGTSKIGKLDAKVHELIALAVAVTTRCDGCIAVHAKKASELGVSREEIAEALSVAITLNAGAALTYSARVLEAVDNLPKR